MRKIIRKIINIFTVQGYFMIIKSRLGLYNNMNDEEYLMKLFKARKNYTLDLKNPKNFNEKLQWLKLYDRNPEYTIMVDKYRVREYIADKIGEKYLIPLIGVWNNPDEIDFDSLPKQFVLKCNHNSGIGLCICKDKEKLNINKVKKELNRGLNQNYYLSSREWPYKNVPKKIICEKYMVDESGYDLKDYKIFCFNGEPKFVQIDYDRFNNHKRKFYDLNWEEMELKLIYSSDNTKIERPSNFDRMLELSRSLSKNIPFLRTDFYVINDSIYFGELTFFPEAGIASFTPEEWNNKLGDLIDLPEKNNSQEG